VTSCPLILHSYDASPFSEKIRLMFGHTGTTWRKLTTPPQPPRPSLDPVLGGYRRIPVLQIGADFFCDTRLVAHEIAILTNRPDLSAETCSETTRADVERFDGEIFRAGISTRSQARLLLASLRMRGLGTIKLIRDRKHMIRAGGFRLGSAEQAQTLWAEHLKTLETRVTPGFLGGHQPNAADFSAYHTIWFARDFVGDFDMAPWPNLSRWYGEMAGFGHGAWEPVKPHEALAMAKDAAARALPEVTGTDSLMGQMVDVSPTDYARDATTGTLIAATERRFVIARDTQGFGKVHIHFPRCGFEITPAG